MMESLFLFRRKTHAKMELTTTTTGYIVMIKTNKVL
jgi:hypothetical protein